MYFSWPTRMLTKSEVGNCNWIISSVSTTLKHTYRITHTARQIKPCRSQTHWADRLTNAGGTATFVRRGAILYAVPVSGLKATAIQCWQTGQWQSWNSSFSHPTLHGQIWDIRRSVDLSASMKDFPSWRRAASMSSTWAGYPGLSRPSKTLSARPI